jgi:hypothetical protein
MTTAKAPKETLISTISRLEKMCQEEFLYMKSITDNFKNPPSSAWNDVNTPIPTEGYIVYWKKKLLTWIPANKLSSLYKFTKTVK